ncbi:MAG: hypothetical protein FWE70_08220 [Oscillospiraceae bacterium]|nr:hypothetical protein [Oscillospiraceae bacterium]
MRFLRRLFGGEGKGEGKGECKGKGAGAGGKGPTEEALAELAEKAGSFVGLFEPIHRISVGEIKGGMGIWADWDVRMANLGGAPELVRFWKGAFGGFERWDEGRLMEGAKTLVGLLSGAGIERGSETEVTADGGAYKRYSTLDGNPIAAGRKARVVSPYWHKGGEVLEKGIMSGMDGEQGV